jgi:hypothetical protein
VVLGEADGEHLERVYRSLSGERVDEELVADGSELSTVMIDVVGTDGEPFIFVVLAEIFEPSIACLWVFDCGIVG